MSVDAPMSEKLIAVVKEASLSRLKFHSKRENIKEIENPEVPLVYAHWMAMILMSGNDLRVTFKAHFMTDSAKFFAANAYRTTKDEITNSRALDFFREYCNITAGRLKVLFDRSDIKTAVSLPALARGFDEIFYLRMPESIHANWILNCENEKIHCSADIDVYKQFTLLDTNDPLDEETGDVDFL